MIVVVVDRGVSEPDEHRVSRLEANQENPGRYIDAVDIDGSRQRIAKADVLGVKVAWPEVEADRAALDGLRSECEKVGLPVTASGLVRHWRNNTAATYALDLHTACHLIGELLDGRDDDLAERGRAFLTHLEESKATAEEAEQSTTGSGASADDAPPMRYDAATDRTHIDWEALPVPTNHQIADHLRAGGKIVKRWDDAPGGWAENPCGNGWPTGWSGTPDDPRPEFDVEDYRLVPITATDATEAEDLA